MRGVLLLFVVLLTACEAPRHAAPQVSANGFYQITEQQAYDLAYASIAAKLGYAPPVREKWKYWQSTLGYEYTGENKPRLVWTVGADFAPAGGGDHAAAVIDAQTGAVLSVQAGRHLR